jgi:UDP-N-acetylglucosamine 2-epimerase (non-hydrolysing)
MKELKVLTVVGTRPEIIRLSCVIKKLDASPAIEHVLVHTGRIMTTN